MEPGPALTGLQSLPRCCRSTCNPQTQHSEKVMCARAKLLTIGFTRGFRKKDRKANRHLWKDS